MGQARRTTLCARRPRRNATPQRGKPGGDRPEPGVGLQGRWRQARVHSLPRRIYGAGRAGDRGALGGGADRAGVPCARRPGAGRRVPGHGGAIRDRRRGAQPGGLRTVQRGNRVPTGVLRGWNRCDRERGCTIAAGQTAMELVADSVRRVLRVLSGQRDGAGSQSGRRGVPSGAGGAVRARTRFRRQHGQLLRGDAGRCGDAVPVRGSVRRAFCGGDGALHVLGGAGLAGVQLRAARGISTGGRERRAPGIRQPGGGNRRHERVQRCGAGGDRLTLFHLLQIWDEERSPRVLAAVGLVAGFAFATKYTAWRGVLCRGLRRRNRKAALALPGSRADDCAVAED